MNVNFGDNNFYVKYLKRFLNHELQQDTAALGKFDTNDLAQLIKYLNLPNVKDMFYVRDDIYNSFSELKSNFNIVLGNDTITWTAKKISETNSEWLVDTLDDIKDYCDTVGWEVTDINSWIDLSKDIDDDGSVGESERNILTNIIYNNYSSYSEAILSRADLNLDGIIDNTDMTILNEYLETGKLYITISKVDRENYFPNKDMLIFVNQFTGWFLYNYAIRDDDGIDDMVHTNTSGLYKVAIYECTPGQKITIAHNNNKATKMVIGCSTATLKQNITTMLLQNVQEVTLSVGEGYQYTCTSAETDGYDAHYVCIQVPSDFSSLDGTNTSTVALDVGDINFDGVIDMKDYYLLANYTATGPRFGRITLDTNCKTISGYECR